MTLVYPGELVAEEAMKLVRSLALEVVPRVQQAFEAPRNEVLGRPKKQDALQLRIVFDEDALGQVLSRARRALLRNARRLQRRTLQLLGKSWPRRGRNNIITMRTSSSKYVVKKYVFHE